MREVRYRPGSGSRSMVRMLSGASALARRGWVLRFELGRRSVTMARTALYNVGRPMKDAFARQRRM